MEEIKVGEYVRYSDGDIQKIQENYIDYFNYVLRNGERLEDGERKIVKHRKKIIDLIEDEDFVVLEYKSPKYRERITRIFEVSKIDKYITFENVHCSFHYIVGNKKITDNICKNIKIKSIVTKEQFQNVQYTIKED